jgi:biotin carboxylase
MDILILHRVPYARIDYGRGIDHESHNVTYFGKREALETLPTGLRCKAIERAGTASAFEEAREWLTAEPHNFDSIISLSEYELLDAARVREWLGVPGPSLDQVSLVRNKLLMKRAVERAGVRVPRFLSLTEFLAARGIAPWERATVLKPHSGASSEGVVVFESPAHAFEAVNNRRTGVANLDHEVPQIGGYEAEEFVSGPILHFDGLVESGRIVTLTASRYVGTCLGYAKGRPLGSYHIPVSPVAGRWAQRVLDAVEIHVGSFHLEAIETPEGLVFLEVGNRVGGADVVATFELATGVHMPSQELRLLLGKPVLTADPVAPHGHRWHGWFVYPGHALKCGAYEGLDGAEDFRSSPFVVTWVELEPGTALKSGVTYSAHEAPLAGIVATHSPDDTRRWIESLFSSISIRTAAAEAANLAGGAQRRAQPRPATPLPLGA